MFLRVTTYKLNRESVDEAEARLEEMMPRVMAMPGMKSFTCATDEEGNGIVAAVYESREKADANQEEVGKLWANFSEYLQGPPTATGRRVIVHMNN